MLLYIFLHDTHTHSHPLTMDNLGFTHYFNIYFCTMGGQWSTQRKPTQTLEEYVNSTQKGLHHVVRTSW